MRFVFERKYVYRLGSASAGPKPKTESATHFENMEEMEVILCKHKIDVGSALITP